MKKLKRKMNSKLSKDSNYEIFYPINNDWLKAYLDSYNLKDLYNNQLIHDLIEKTLNNINKNITNKEILSIIKNQNEIQNIINNNSIKIKEKNNQIPIHPEKIKINNFYYYKNFILVSQNTIEALSLNYSKNKHFHCYLGENKIFAIINNHLINIYTLDKNDNIIPEIFYQFYEENELVKSLNNLKMIGYEKYIKTFCVFGHKDKTEDYASPIFDQDNKEIGYAFKYHSNIKYYTPYIINEEYKAFLILYFYYLSLGKKSNLIDKKYFLINEEFMRKYKEYYEYENIIKLFNNDALFNQVLDNINKGNNNWNDILSDKTINLIIKNLPFDINKKFKEKSKIGFKPNYIKEEPKIKHVQNSEIFYYDEFELIDEELYDILFQPKEYLIYKTCYFINEFIYLQIPQNLNIKSKYSFILFGSLEQNNMFKAKYLLECKTNEDFRKINKYANTIGGLDIYLNSKKFNNNVEQLYDDKNIPLGLIYNLSFVPLPKQNMPKLEKKPSISKQKIIKTIKEDFQSPLLIGLQYIGDFPHYMNSVIQCFCQIEKIVNYFKYNDDISNAINKYNKQNKFCLTNSFKIIIENLWTNGIKYINNKFFHENISNKYFAPYKLLQIMKKNFESPQDLVNFIILNLHEELNIHKKEENLINNNMPDQSDQIAMLKFFIKNFQKDYYSFISDNFYGTLQTQFECLNCKLKRYN